MTTPDTIFDYIKQQETAYAQEIEVVENWKWNMKDHIRTTILCKHGQFKHATNEEKYKAPYKNIILPILNLQYRAEDIDVKDIALYVNDADKYHLSFLVKKYHDEVYIKQKKLDTFLDEEKEERIDYGGVLVRNTNEGPIYESMETIAFCDQTDIMAGPIGFKLALSPDELYDMEKQGWGDKKKGADVTIEELVILAGDSKEVDVQTQQKNQTPGKYIEVYRVHGVMPRKFLKETKDDDERYTRQLQIVGYYKTKEGTEKGVTLYKAKEYENPFKLNLRGKKIKNRALALGGAEELFGPQIWTNYSEIRKRDVIDAVSKIIRWTNDEAMTNRNKIRDMENNEFITVREGAQMGTLDNGAPNIPLFNEWINEWGVHAQTTGGATDALLGKQPPAGSPFKLQDAVIAQGQGLHDYRRGKDATFIEEIYRDWVLPDIAKEITKGVKFLATLSPDELEYVMDCLVRNEAKKYEDELVFSGEDIDPAQTEAFKQQVRDEFKRGGPKKFLEILKGEFAEVPLAVSINVAGKQKDLQAMTDKLSNVFKQIFANPAILDNPKAAKIFNKLMEYSGFDPFDFGYATSNPQQPQPIAQGQQPGQPVAQPSPITTNEPVMA